MGNRTDSWTKYQKLIVDNTFSDEYAARGDSIKSQYSTKMVGNKQLAISYNSKLKVFTIWNLAIRKFIVGEKSECVCSIGVKGIEVIKRATRNSITIYYKKIGNGPYKDCVERIIFIGADALSEFCRNYEYYFFPSINENFAGKKLLFAIPGGKAEILEPDNVISYEIIREKERIVRAKRDPKFRELVLDRFSNRCAVCGSTEISILQAAHIKSVANGGTDDISNGICLCANHHRLFDAGLIEINHNRKTFFCNNTPEMKMPWYLEAKKRGFKLFWPDSK